MTETTETGRTDAGRRVFVGGYSGRASAVPQGLGLFRGDRDGWRLLDGLDLTNPTFGVFDPKREVLYTSHSGQDYLSAVAVRQERTRLEPLNQAPIGSVNPAHLALSPDRRFLVAASFTSGHVSVVRVRESGELGELVAAIPTTGTVGPLRVQSGSQPHQVVFAPGGRHLFVPDRGCDLVRVFRFAAHTGALTELAPAPARPGAGPRHLVFTSTDTAWGVNELDNTLTAYRWDAEAERLAPLSVRPTLPADFFGASAGGGIAAGSDGQLLHVSNRGHDSIATFALGPDGPHCLGWTPVGGRTPRFLGVDPATGDLWVTAQDSDRVQRFIVDSGSGLPRFAESIDFTAPACVVFA